MYYASGTELPAGTWQMLHEHSPDCSTFLHVMTSWPPPFKYDVTSETWFRQSMRIYYKNTPVKFHPDPIWNDAAVIFG